MLPLVSGMAIEQPGGSWQRSLFYFSRNKHAAVVQSTSSPKVIHDDVCTILPNLHVILFARHAYRKLECSIAPGRTAGCPSYQVSSSTRRFGVSCA
jgi:hypothetical protein